MDRISSWVLERLEENAPERSDDKSSIERVASTCAALRGRGSQVFGMVLPAGGIPEAPALYRRACEILESWFSRLDEEEGLLLAALARRNELDIAVPPEFDAVLVDAPDESWKESAPVSHVQDVGSRLESNPAAEAVDRSWERVLANLRWTQQCAERRRWFLLEDLDASPPANAKVLAAVEHEIDLRLPNDFLHVLGRCSATTTLCWLAEDPSTAPQGEFDSIYQGGVEGGLWNVNSIVGLRRDCERWRDAAGGGPGTETFKIWDTSIAFAGDNGSFLALAVKPDQDTYPVVYLHHEGDPDVGHGRVLAPSFIEFIERWSRLGCPGLGFESLELFCDEGGISTSTTVARDWRRWLGE